MKYLLSLVETLLHEHDCVIVPDFGGFVAYQQPAVWAEERQLFLPPKRTVGFNQRLNINDGLLVQEYMSEMGTSFPDAQRQVAKAVRLLKNYLYAEGRLNINEVGVLHVSPDGMFHFTPYIDGILSDNTYGLVEMPAPMLTEEQMSAVRTPAAIIPLPYGTSTETPEQEKTDSGTPWWEYVGKVAAAVAIVVFFLYSQPVGNDGVISAAWQGGVSSPMPSVRTEIPVQEIEQPVAVQQEDTVKIESDAPLRYYIVVETWETKRMAEARVAKLKEQGYANACVIDGSVKRVCIDGAATMSEAVSLQTQYKSDFKRGMWIHHVRS